MGQPYSIPAYPSHVLALFPTQVDGPFAALYGPFYAMDHEGVVPHRVHGPSGPSMAGHGLVRLLQPQHHSRRSVRAAS